MSLLHLSLDRTTRGAGGRARTWRPTAGPGRPAWVTRRVASTLTRARGQPRSSLANLTANAPHNANHAAHAPPHSRQTILRDIPPHAHDHAP